MDQFNLLFISLLSLLLLVNGGIFHLYWRRQRRFRQLKAVVLIQQVRSLIALMQCHRRRFMQFSQGINLDKNELFDIQEQIRECLRQMRRGQGLEVFERWLAFVDHWSRLNTAYQMSPEACFEQHNIQIDNLVLLLDDIAEHFGFQTDSAHSPVQLKLLWKELVEVTELLGKIRVIQSNHQQLSQAERVRLAALVGALNDSQIKLSSQLTHLHTVTDRQTLLSLLSQAGEQIETLTVQVQSQLKEEDNSQRKLASISLSQLASKAIYQIFDIELAGLRERYEYQ